jgi:hypothetical protein
MWHTSGQWGRHDLHEGRTLSDASEKLSLFRELGEECDGWVRELRSILPIHGHPLTIQPSGASGKGHCEEHR